MLLHIGAMPPAHLVCPLSQAGRPVLPALCLQSASPGSREGVKGKRPRSNIYLQLLTQGAAAAAARQVLVYLLLVYLSTNGQQVKKSQINRDPVPARRPPTQHPSHQPPTKPRGHALPSSQACMSHVHTGAVQAPASSATRQAGRAQGPQATSRLPPATPPPPPPRINAPRPTQPHTNRHSPGTAAGGCVPAWCCAAGPRGARRGQC